jgi:hypothetical protein
MRHRFLTSEWIAAARAIYEEASPAAAPVPARVRLNLVVTGVPFGTGTLHAHVDTSEGSVEIGLDHVESPHATATLDYATAKTLLIDADPQAGMQAFLAGKIRLQGDLTKALVVQARTPDLELLRRIQEITEP